METHDTIDARLVQLQRAVAVLLASERITARRLTLIEQQLSNLESQDEEVLFRKFTARYYSETLVSVRCEYEAELAEMDRFRRVLLSLACHLPQGEQRVAERLLSERGPKVQRNGDLTLTELEI